MIDTEQAWYFDGRSADRTRAHVSWDGSRIMATLDGREQVNWSTSQFRTVSAGRELRLEAIPYTGEVIVLEDTSFFHGPGKSAAAHNAGIVLLLLAVAAGLVAALYFAAGPVTTALARMVPAPVDERIGYQVVKVLAPEDERMASKELVSVVSGIASRLDDRSQYKVIVSRSGEVNAFAAPGNYIVVYCGLIRAMNSPEALAGVLAHEMTHLRARHPTRNLIRTVGTRLLLSLILGGGDVLSDSATTLGILHYMRSDEEEADTGGQQLLFANRVNPIAVADAFAELRTHGRDVPSALKYLSTHPLLEDRERRARVEAARFSGHWEPVLPQPAWRRVKFLCNCD